MLSRIKINGYRCLRSVAVPLKPLTVLVGPNDSGKSSFLRAILVAHGRSEFRGQDRWRLIPDSPATIITFVNANVAAEFRIAEGGSPREFKYSPEAAKTQIFTPPMSGVAMLSAGAPDEKSLPTLGSKCENVPALVDYFLRRDRKRFFSFVEALKPRIPGLEDIDVPTPEPSTRRIDLKIDNGLVISAEEASVGVRLMLFFVALTYHPDPPNIILLEEPENGVHPKRLADIVALLRDITRGVNCGHAAQVILTTHSPYLLDHIDPSTDQVLVFRRDADGSRTAEPVDEARLKPFLEEFMLGEVWFNQEEAGLVGRKE